MKMGILIVSCARDAEWLGYCLRGIKRWSAGYHRVVVVSDCPNEIRPVCEHGGSELVEAPTRPGVEGWLAQQIPKMTSDILLPDCDYVLHMDSDCIFREPNTPETWFQDGKPILYKRRYSLWPKGAPSFQDCTQKALGYPCEFETMCRFPFCYIPHTVKACREHIEKLHGMSIDQFITTRPPYRFSEFNAIGSHLVRFFSDLYTVINTRETRVGPEKLKQFSGAAGPVSEAERAEIERMLA